MFVTVVSHSCFKCCYECFSLSPIHSDPGVEGRRRGEEGRGGGGGRGGGEEGIKRNIYPFTPHVHTKPNLLGVCRRHDSLVSVRCKSIISVSTQPTYSTRIRVCACMVKSHASLIHTLRLCTLLLLLLSTLKQYCSPGHGYSCGR